MLVPLLREIDELETDGHPSVNGSKTQVAGWSTYTLLLWVVKAAMCTFYLRLTVCALPGSADAIH